MDDEDDLISSDDDLLFAHLLGDASPGPVGSSADQELLLPAVAEDEELEILAILLALED